MTAIRAVPLPGERTLLYGQIGLQLVDDLTGAAPLGRVDLHLDVFDAQAAPQNQWRRTGASPTLNAGGVFFYPKLGFRARVDQPPQQTRYRVRIDAQYYRPLYRHSSQGIEFDVTAYNHQNPLPKDKIRRGPAGDETARILLPAVNYPFPSHLPLVRGIVVQPAQPADEPIADANVHLKALPDATVEHGVRKALVLTGDDGGFALPVRWLAHKTTTTADAAQDDDRISVNVVDGLASYAEVAIRFGGNAGAGTTQFKVTAIDGTGTTRILTLDPELPDDLDEGSEVRLIAFHVFVKPTGGAERAFPIPLADAFTKNHKLVIPPQT